jgi:hypothetical protein
MAVNGTRHAPTFIGAVWPGPLAATLMGAVSELPRVCSDGSGAPGSIFAPAIVSDRLRSRFRATR